jgi:hypothetical protein
MKFKYVILTTALAEEAEACNPLEVFLRDSLCMGQTDRQTQTQSCNAPSTYDLHLHIRSHTRTNINACRHVVYLKMAFKRQNRV